MTAPRVEGGVAELLRLSELATKGEWKLSPWHIEEGPSAVRAGGIYVCNTASDQEAEFIAAAVNFIRSDAFRQMAEGMAEVERLRAELVDMTAMHDRACIGQIFNMERAEKAQAECTALRKDKEQLHAMLVLSAEAVMTGEGVSLGYYIEDIAPKAKAQEVNAYIDAHPGCGASVSQPSDGEG